MDGTGTEDQKRDEEWMPACQNCGLPIRESQQPQAKFGWTHTGDWEGVRCPGRVTGAVPDVRAAYRAGREDAAREEDQKRSTERSWILPIDSKADVLFADGKHRYWSTHCRHGRHDACSATVIEGMDVHEDMLAYVARKPAQCKTCSSPCLCTCHKDQPVGDGVQPTEEQRAVAEDQKRDEENP